MELVKKEILQAVTTGLTACTGTTGYCYVIIPDLSVIYDFKIALNQAANDLGFFDTYEVTGGTISGVTTFPLVSTLVTGTTSNSRLSELKKYAVGVPFSNQYVGNGSLIVDGVDYANSISGITITYYIGGIKYIDDVTGLTTTFSLVAQGSGSSNFTNLPYYKDPNKSKIISNPKIKDDVFIIRNDLSAFDKNYRLEYIRSMVDLTTYAGGKFFKIVNNT